MHYWTYILECNDGSFYTGSTTDLEKRLEEHNRGEGANWTKKKLPVKLVYCEEHKNIEKAFLREKQIQGWSRAKKIALISGHFESLSDLALSSKQKEALISGHFESLSDLTLSSKQRKEISDMNKIKLMSHLVAGYPTDELSLTAARALVKGGADILEIQLPFSDPSADGPAIQDACTKVLERKYRTADGLAFIEKLHKEFPDTPIYLMSYGSLIYTPGVEAFCKRAAEAGVKGMIIPDLPFDHDEGLTAACKANGMENIPVAAPSMSDERLSKLAHAGFKYIYAALRAGITGTNTTIDDATLKFLEKVGDGGSKIYGGFGISNGEQSGALASSVEAVVAGSVFVRIISENQDDAKALAEKIEAKAKEITHS